MAKDPYRYYRLEARELLEGLGQGVLELERGEPNKELVAKLLRLAHTLKGASRVVKLADVASQVHQVEDALAPYREQGGPVPREAVDAVLKLLDRATARIAAIDAPAPPAPEESAPSPPPRRAAIEEPLATVRVELADMDLLLESVTEATVLVHGLRRDSEALERARDLAGRLSAQLGAQAGLGVGATRVRDLAEELEGLLGRARRETGTSLEQVGRELGQVREAADRLRLLPASVVFAPLERAVRDAARHGGKRVALHASGGARRLDAHVLEGLRDPLQHLVRNAVAHGIEPEADRVAAGKPPTGEIHLDVERRGGVVAFVCRDDGAGIDLAAVRRAAVRSGALSGPAADAAPAADLFALLLRGGISTSREVNEIAGRGVGLDAVREAVARLGGDVHVESTPGHGTRVELRVPASLSSITALVVEAGGITAAVPLEAVLRTLRVAAADVARAPRGDSIVFEGAVVPLVPLARILGRPAGARDLRARTAVVVRAGDGCAAVEVDRLLATAPILVRPLPAHAQAEPSVLGAALDAEGDPQVVLDPVGLIAAVRADLGEGRAPERAARLPVLVIDDSLTTRMLEQSILQSAGYEVDLATSAEEGLAKATDRRYGLFMVDVEMPGMSGFEFVATTRGDPRLSSIPAILVTSRGSAEDRKRGLDAGARAYVVKGEFDQGQLLRTIAELLG